MKQKSFATGSFEEHRKPTHKERFVQEMDQIIPWQALSAVIEPHYPNA